MAEALPLLSVSSASLRWLVLVCVGTTIPAVLLAGWIIAILGSSLLISENAVEIRSFGFSKRLDFADLDLDNGKIVDPYKDEDFRRVVRTGGIGLPGFQVGWFRLRNGADTLVFLGDKNQKALYLPTRKNYSLLLGSDDPSTVWNAMQRARISTSAR